MTTAHRDDQRQRKPDPVAEVVEFKPYRDGYAVKFDYDPFLVALVKKLPQPERSYNQDRKFWTLTDHAARFVAHVARSTGYTVRGIAEHQPGRDRAAP